MPSPYQYPWVKFGSITVANIDSSEQLLYTAVNATIFDSIIVTNTTKQEIFIDFSMLTERLIDGEPVNQKPFVARNRLIEKYQSLELLPATQSILILEAGDFVYANSDFSNNTFDCIISYRQLLED